MQSLDVRFAQPECGELRSHLLATGIRLTQTGADVAAPQSDCAEDSKLHQNRDIEGRSLIDDCYREIKYVAEECDQQHSGRRKYERADGDYKYVERSKLRRRPGLGDVDDRRHQKQIEEDLDVKEPVTRAGRCFHD